MKIDLDGIKKVDEEIERCEDMLDSSQKGEEGLKTFKDRRYNILMARIQGLLYAKRVLIIDD